MARTRVAVACAVVAALAARTAPASAQGAAEPKKIHVEARLMFWADVSGRQSVPDQQETITDFFVRRARILLQGRVTKDLTLSFQLGSDNIGSKVLTEDDGIHVKDAYMNYRARDAFQVALGQFKIPFLRSNLESGFNQVLVDRGTLPGVRPAREGSRDLGAMAWGNVNSLQYRVALFDGSDQDTRNPESSIRVSTRVAYNWFTKETGSGYTGTYMGSKRVLQVAAQLDTQGSRVDPRDDADFRALARDYRAYALEAFFEGPFADGWTFTAEGAWVDRNDDYIEPRFATRRVRGYYVQPAVLLPGHVGPGRLQIAFRREDWDTDRGSIDQTTTRSTIGGTYFLKGHDRKVQADFTHKGEARDLDNDEFRLSLVLVF